jgi:tol-pal system protein YbgF
VEQLEAQLVDLQVVIGTLESLAKSGGAGAAAAAPRGAAPAPVGGYSSSDGGRIDGLETQMQALTAQLEQLAAQVRALSGGRGGQLGGAANFAARDAAPGGRMTLNDSGGALRPGSVPSGGFGSTVVTPGGDDQIGRMINDAGPSQGADRPGAGAAVAMEAPGNSKQSYETAYGYLLQQNYEAAESAFDDFLKRYPDDPLAGNAQYWLGETLYVRGQFKQAASAFLKGYQTYARSTKAPDSLLKLAMSLDRLGQRDAACSSYNELGTRFPNAPSHVRTRADSERKRVGC